MTNIRDIGSATPGAARALRRSIKIELPSGTLTFDVPELLTLKSDTTYILNAAPGMTQEHIGEVIKALQAYVQQHGFTNVDWLVLGNSTAIERVPDHVLAGLVTAASRERLEKLANQSVYWRGYQVMTRSRRVWSVHKEPVEDYEQATKERDALIAQDLWSEVTIRPVAIPLTGPEKHQ